MFYRSCSHVIREKVDGIDDSHCLPPPPPPALPGREGMFLSTRSHPMPVQSCSVSIQNHHLHMTLTGAGKRQ